MHYYFLEITNIGNWGQLAFAFEKEANFKEIGRKSKTDSGEITYWRIQLLFGLFYFLIKAVLVSFGIFFFLLFLSFYACICADL